MEQNVPKVKNDKFLAISPDLSDACGMEQPAKKKKTRTSTPPPATTPKWALRFRLALEQAGYVDERGKIDKKRLGEKFLVTPKAVEHWVNGAREPRFSVIVTIATESGCSTDWMLGLQDAPPFARDRRPPSSDK
jgi:hypothetical protein